jgi:hypothetical protein
MGPNTISPVKNQERSLWLKERWEGGGKGSGTGDLSALRIDRMPTRPCGCKTSAKAQYAVERLA